MYDESPTLQVRVLRGRQVVHEEFCESREQADRVIDEWSDDPGVSFDVRDVVALTERIDADDREVAFDDDH